MKPPRVTIIVPAYKRDKPLVTTLSSLRRVDYPETRLEILVVDQSPTHDRETLTFLHQANKAGWITLFEPPAVTFASLTKARNFGIKRATNPDIIIFVDDDVEVKPDFVQKHVEAYEDDGVMAVAGRITVPSHTYPSAEPNVVARITWWGNFINNFYGTREMDSDGFVGCNCSVRASVLKKTDLFDERFIGNAIREETDLAVRIREVGGRIRYVPDAHLLHHMDAGGGTRSFARLEWYFAYFHNHFLFYRKHTRAWRIPFFILHMIRPMIACWLVYGKGTPKAFITPWRGIFAGIASANKARKMGQAVVKKPVNRIF